MSTSSIFWTLLAFWIVGVSTSRADDLRIATFNTESDPAFTTWPVNVAKTITKIGRFDILAVQEVESEEALKLYASAAAHSQGGDWRYVISESGTNGTREPDLLGIIYSTKLFRQLGTHELHSIRSRPDNGTYGKPDWSLRGALVLRIQHIATGHEFQVATVHLKCCNEPAVRAHQAAILARELAASSLPTILLGDTNIPIEPGETAPSGDNLEAFESLTTGANLAWVQPSNPVKTQCSPSFNSMLDQIYGPAGAAASAEIMFPEAAYCAQEEDGWADHRPMRAVFTDFLVETADGETPPTAAPTGAPSAEAEASDEARAEELEFQIQQAARPGTISAD